jgi:hypothetical protein
MKINRCITVSLAVLVSYSSAVYEKCFITSTEVVGFDNGIPFTDFNVINVEPAKSTLTNNFRVSGMQLCLSND